VKRFAAAGLVILLLIVGIGIITWPLFTHFGTHIVSEKTAIHDGNIFPVWFSWYLANRAPEIAKSPVLFRKTTLWFHPFGVDMYLTNPGYYWLSLTGFYRMVFGFPEDINLLAMTILIVNGLAFFAVARQFQVSRDIAAVSAVLYTVSPYSCSVFDGNTDQALSCFLILFIPWMLEACWRGGRKTVLAAAGLLTLCGIFYWFFAAFGIVLGLLVLPAIMGTQKPGHRWKPAIRLFVIYLIFLSASMPFLYPILGKGLATGKVQGVSPGSFLPGQFGKTDPSLFITAEKPLHVLKSPWVLFTASVAFGALIIFKAGGALHLLFAGISYIFWLFTLGIDLRLSFFGPPVPLPFAALKTIFPIFSRIAYSGRFGVVLHIALALLFATALESVFRKRTVRGRTRAVILVLLFASAMMCARMNLKVRPSAVPGEPAAAAAVKNEQGLGVIDVPLLWEAVATEGAWYQTFHGLPIITGPGVEVEYGRPTQFDQLLKENTFLAAVVANKEGSKLNTAQMKEDAKKLVELGFGYLIHHKSAKAWYMTEESSGVGFKNQGHVSPPSEEGDSFVDGLPMGEGGRPFDDGMERSFDDGMGNDKNPGFDDRGGFDGRGDPEVRRGSGGPGGSGGGPDFDGPGDGPGEHGGQRDFSHPGGSGGQSGFDGPGGPDIQGGFDGPGGPDNRTGGAEGPPPTETKIDLKPILISVLGKPILSSVKADVYLLPH